MKTLNFNSRQIISKEELVEFDKSLRSLSGGMIVYGSENLGRGILDVYDGSSLVNDHFSCSIGSVPEGGYDTLRIDFGLGVMNLLDTSLPNKIDGLAVNNQSIKESKVFLFNFAGANNIVINSGEYGDGDEAYVGFDPIVNQMEEGVCGISVNGQVAIEGGSFDGVRGQTFKNPTRIRFYKEDGSVAINNSIYEVVSKVDSSNIIITGTLVKESGLRYVIVGSYDLGVQGDLWDKTAFVGYSGEVVTKLSAEDFGETGGFPVCKLTFNSSGGFTISDIRSDNLFNFSANKDVLFRNRISEIISQFTFKAPPKFDSGVIIGFDPSFSDPILLGSSGGMGFYQLELPDLENGSLINIKAVAPHDIISGIVFDTVFIPGFKFFLRVDPKGGPLRIRWCTLFPNRIRPNNITDWLPGQTVGDFVVAPGSILEILRLNTEEWIILNSESISNYTIWSTIASIFNSGGTNVNSPENRVSVKKERNTVFMHISSVANEASPLNFNLPSNMVPSLPIWFDEGYITEGGVAAKFSIRITEVGVVTISYNSPPGQINKMVSFQL